MAIVVAVSCFASPASAVTAVPREFVTLPFPCYDYVGYSSTSLRDDNLWFSPETVRNFCSTNFDVDFSGYSLLYICSQPGLPSYDAKFAKPLSDDAKLVLTKSGSDYYCVAYGDWDVYSVFFQYFYGSDGDSGYFGTPSIYHNWNGTINAYFVGYSELSIYNQDGDPINDTFSASLSVSSDGSNLNCSITSGNLPLTFNMGIYDSSGNSVGIDYITMGTCEENATVTRSIDLVNARTNLEDQDVDFDSLIGKLVVINENGKSEEYTVSLSGTGEKEGLFSKEKELTPFTDIEDYVDWDFDPFPGFDPEHPIDSIANILQWIGGIIKKIVTNIVGILRWLKDNFFILIENIGKLLYNLVVKLRKLVEYLFIPDTKKMIAQVSKSSPAMGELLSASELVKNLQGQVDNVMTFTFLGEQCTFRIANYVPENLASGMRSFSTVVILGGGFMSILNTFMSFLGMNGFARYVGDHVDISDR